MINNAVQLEERNSIVSEVSILIGLLMIAYQEKNKKGIVLLIIFSPFADTCALMRQEMI